MFINNIALPTYSCCFFVFLLSSKYRLFSVEIFGYERLQENRAAAFVFFEKPSLKQFAKF